MNAKRFDTIVESRVRLIRKILVAKRAEYVKGGDEGDRLHNFNRAAAMLNESREKALIGMLSKHLVSILDIADKIEEGEFPTVEMLEEKIGDAINYLILLEAMIKEDIEK